MTLVLLTHVVVAILAAALGARLGRRVMLVGGLAPLATVGWSIANAGGILDGAAVEERYRWIPGLGLEMSFHVDALSLVMLSLVGGIGALVFLYGSRYFGDEEPALGRFTALLVAFAAAMTGLVTADDLISLFVFWELTSVTSYGLIGFNDTSAAARASATQALVVTGSGGLVLLAGLLLVRLESGATTLSELTELRLEGTVATWAAVLVLVGAFTKSAQVPFHGWLPGAMAAPTPVSAYLHSATMVKAGVYLVARMSPVMSDIELWRTLTVGVGVATMLWGGYRSLRQDDLKLILAYGTVSQLGMLVATFGGGTSELYLAGVAMLLAHGLFKATLFMSVGIVDHSAHTRDIHRLSGLGRRLPVLTATSVVAGASMAGIIPLFGFVAKETVIGGFLYADFALVDLALAGIVVGSGFTAAYTIRCLWGAFGTEAGVETPLHRPDAWFVLPTVVLTVPTVLLGVLPAIADELVLPAAATLDDHAADHHLHLWPGFVLGFWLSMAALAIGGALWLLRAPVEELQRRLARRRDAGELFQSGLSGTLRGATWLTSVVQNGSLPAYMAVILLGIVFIPGLLVLGGLAWPDDVVAADSLIQGVLVVGVMAAAGGVTVARSRFGAVLMLGAVGMGVTGLFVVQGAPDLALTQVIVEIVSLSVFVLVLRHLPERFVPTDWTLARAMRLATSAIVGVAVFVVLVTSIASRTADPVDDQIAALAYPEGEGKNIVNVTLVDIRGFDTVGETVVLAVAALGVTSLVTAGRRRAQRSSTSGAPAGTETGTDDEPRREEIRA